MVFEKTRKDKGKKQDVLVVEEDDIAANGPRGRRVQNGLEAEVELLRRQLQALTDSDLRSIHPYSPYFNPMTRVQ